MNFTRPANRFERFPELLTAFCVLLILWVPINEVEGSHLACEPLEDSKLSLKNETVGLDFVIEAPKENHLNGKPWDKGSKPDIMVCLRSAMLSSLIG